MNLAQRGNAETVLYWLLDTYIPKLNLPHVKEVEFKGEVLIMSKQLWTLISDDVVRSCLIGPGVIKGIALYKGYPIKVEEAIGILVFNPAELRPSAPIPLVNIVTPEVIDPLAKSSASEIATVIERVLVDRGMVLAPKKLTEVRRRGTIPTIEYREKFFEKIEVHLTSGVMKAKFLLGGAKRPIYEAFLKRYEKRVYERPEKLRVLYVDERKFASFGQDAVSHWSIVEKIQAQPLEEQQTENGYKQFVDEYMSVVDFIKKFKDAYIFRD